VIVAKERSVMEVIIRENIIEETHVNATIVSRLPGAENQKRRAEKEVVNVTTRMLS
jgi:hypothetical protein